MNIKASATSILPIYGSIHPFSLGLVWQAKIFSQNTRNFGLPNKALMCLRFPRCYSHSDQEPSMAARPPKPSREDKPGDRLLAIIGSFGALTCCAMASGNQAVHLAMNAGLRATYFFGTQILFQIESEYHTV